MYLILQAEDKQINYAAFTADCAMLYSGNVSVKDWSDRAIHRAIETEFLARVRGHGRVFTRIGIMIPFAEPSFWEPRIANVSLFKTLATSRLSRAVIAPALHTANVAHRGWPHLTHYFLFDTCLSHLLDRHIVLAPFGYDTIKRIKAQPHLLNSYAHKANIHHLKTNKRVVSLYVGRQTSIALFDGRQLVDAIVSYSPESSIMGLTQAGAIDPGFYALLAEKQRPADVNKILLDESGLNPMNNTDLPLDSLLQIAGLAPRASDFSTGQFTIEAIEWLGLSLRAYLRAIRHGIGSLVAHGDVEGIIVNTSYIPQTSYLWSNLISGNLKSLKLLYVNTSPLEAACHDLANIKT